MWGGEGRVEGLAAPAFRPFSHRPGCASRSLKSRSAFKPSSPEALIVGIASAPYGRIVSPGMARHTTSHHTVFPFSPVSFAQCVSSPALPGSHVAPSPAQAARNWTAFGNQPPTWKEKRRVDWSEGEISLIHMGIENFGWGKWVQIVKWGKGQHPGHLPPVRIGVQGWAARGVRRGGGEVVHCAGGRVAS
jgi:hypothetical protein